MREPKSAEAVADIVDDLECRNEFSKHHLVGGNRQGQSGHSYYKRDYNQRGSHGYSNKSGGGYQGNTVNTDSTPSVGTNVQEPIAKGKVLVSSPTPPQAGSVNTNGNTNGNSANYRKKPIICYAPGHIKPNCPNRVRRLSPCEEEEDDNDDAAEPTWVDGWVGSHKIEGMRYDSGCDRTVVDKQFVPTEAYLGQQVTLKGWRGRQTSNHELARIDIKVGDVMHKGKLVAVAEQMEYPALLGADMSRAVRCEIMRRVMEDWAEEPRVKGQAMEAMECDAVRVTRAQARCEKEGDEANLIASEQSDCSPTPLDSVFDFSDDRCYFCC